MEKLRISISYKNTTFKNRIQYVFKYLEQHPLVKGKWFFFFENNPDSNIRIHYEDPHSNMSHSRFERSDFFIPAQNLLFHSKQVTPLALYCNLYLSADQMLFSVENQQEKSQNFMRKNCFQFDIIETIFFHISRYEEVFASKNDQNKAGWLNEKSHFLVRHQIQEIPIVDHLVKAFYETLSSQKIRQKTTYDISHDLDILFRLRPTIKVFRAIVGSIITSRGLKKFPNIIHHAWKMKKEGKNDPYDNFEILLRNEKIWKSKHLFLMVGGKTKYDNKYSIHHPRIDEIIKLAKERGYEIGLHPSYNAGFQPKMFAEEFKQLSEKLKCAIKLNRQHWLRFDWNVTPFIWEENNIETDYSMGYTQHLGFRCGTGFAYFMYNFRKEEAFSWKEQPMALMESSAIHYAGQNHLSLEKVMVEFLLKNKLNTHININFHNSNFDPHLETGQQISDFYCNRLIQIIES